MDEAILGESSEPRTRYQSTDTLGVGLRILKIQVHAEDRRWDACYSPFKISLDGRHAIRVDSQAVLSASPFFAGLGPSISWARHQANSFAV